MVEVLVNLRKPTVLLYHSYKTKRSYNSQFGGQEPATNFSLRQAGCSVLCWASRLPNP